jgi:hypothetical protein
MARALYSEIPPMFYATFAGWGVANSDRFKVIAELRVSDQITDESRALGSPWANLRHS